MWPPETHTASLSCKRSPRALRGSNTGSPHLAQGFGTDSSGRVQCSRLTRAGVPCGRVYGVGGAPGWVGVFNTAPGLGVLHAQRGFISAGVCVCVRVVF